MLDPTLLRTFLAFVESGTLARAAATVGRSPSAVTSQMKALESQIGEPLTKPLGRRLELTRAGHDLVGHARRILAAHNEALLSIVGARKDGAVAIGTTQDFVNSDLPRLLAVFARTHPRVRLDLRIGRSHELDLLLRQGALDLTVSAKPNINGEELVSWREDTVWLVGEDGIVADDPVVPIALLDAPCSFRTLALGALECSKRQYRIAATSQSLAGLLAMTRAGLAVTLRTPRSLTAGVRIAPKELLLPHTQPITFGITQRAGVSKAAETLAGLLAEHLIKNTNKTL